MRYYAGVDLGASMIRVVVGTNEWERVGSARRHTPHGPSGIDVTEGVLETIRGACRDADIAPDRLEAAGIGSFGPFDLAEGMIVDPANLPEHVSRIPLVGPVGELIDSDQVYLHNDTTAGVIGERFLADRNPDDMVYLTISTGISAGIAVDGHIVSGWDGNAGEVGHFTVDPEGRLTCGCGRDGHWEAYASGRGIPTYAQWLAERLDVADESTLDLDAPGFAAPDVFTARDDDPLADAVLERVARWNAIGVANVVHAYAPLVISIGGSVALHNVETVVDPLRTAIGELVMSNVPEIKVTSQGEDVVVLGALASAMTRGTGDHARLQR